MKWTSEVTTPKELKLIIEQDLPEVGYYVYVWENGKCTYDYLQDTYEQAVGFAHRQFGVPRDSWQRVD